MSVKAGTFVILPTGWEELGNAKAGRLLVTGCCPALPHRWATLVLAANEEDEEEQKHFFSAAILSVPYAQSHEMCVSWLVAITCGMSCAF